MPRKRRLFDGAFKAKVALNAFRASADPGVAEVAPTATPAILSKLADATESTPSTAHPPTSVRPHTNDSSAISRRTTASPSTESHAEPTRQGNAEHFHLVLGQSSSGVGDAVLTFRPQWMDWNGFAHPFRGLIAPSDCGLPGRPQLRSSRTTGRLFPRRCESPPLGVFARELTKFVGIRDGFPAFSIDAGCVFRLQSRTELQMHHHLFVDELVSGVGKV